MTRTPSRLLNEKMNFLSLSVVDISALGYVLILSHSALSIFGLELLSFAVLAVVSSILISVRIKYRPKTIRDFFQFKISSSLN